MSETEGQNKPSGEYLTSLFERVESIREDKKQLGADEAAVFAEAKAKGYDTKILKRLLKLRQMSPSDRSDEDAMMDIYLDVTGMARQPSLFSVVDLMTVDTAVREQVIEAYGRLVPKTGDVIVRFEEKPVRLWRDAAGEVQVEDWKEPSPDTVSRDTPAKLKRPGIQKPVPDVDEDGAFELGKAAFGEDRPVTDNPFPARDKRRRAWDRGWREASGGDGMGRK